MVLARNIGAISMLKEKEMISPTVSHTRTSTPKMAPQAIHHTPHTNDTYSASIPTGTLVAIDVGTTKVCTIVGRNTKNRGIRVLAYNTVPCSGLRKGNVVDVEATAKAVRTSIKKMESEIGHRIESAFIGVTGAHVDFENKWDSLKTSDEKGLITTDDLMMPAESPTKPSDEPERRLLHALRMGYSVDGKSGIRNPIGMHSNSVEVKTHYVTGSSSFIRRLTQAIDKSGIRIDSLVLEPLASGVAVLTPAEKEHGTLLVDIGGGTTDIVIFKRGQICYTGVVPIGGFQFTNDIVLTFNTSYEAAESAKLQHANTDLHTIATSDEEISLPIKGQDNLLRVPRLDICQLTRERAQELAQMIKLKLKEANIVQPSDLRLVLTGGASNLPGLAKLMERTIGIRVRQGIPTLPNTLPETLRDPVYATSVGILAWAATEHHDASKPSSINIGHRLTVTPKAFLYHLIKMASKLMPSGLFTGQKGRM